MPFIKTEIPEVIIFDPKVFSDNRGYFFETYHKKVFEEAGISNKFIQDNQSYSQYGTLRGLHFQKGKNAQAKLISVVKGEILDVAVDIRINSATFGKFVSHKLSEDNHRQLFIPVGFAHGFSVLSEDAIIQYKCNSFYNKESEGCILYSDKDLNIDWQLLENDIILSDKDKLGQSFKEYKNNPCF